MNKNEELKCLHLKLSRMESDLSEINDKCGEVQRLSSLKQIEIREIGSAISRLSTKEIKVVDHAVLRYLERGMQIDMDAIRAKILSSGALNGSKFIPNGKYPMGDGLIAIIKDNHVITIQNH